MSLPEPDAALNARVSNHASYGSTDETPRGPRELGGGGARPAYWTAWHEPRRLVVSERTLRPPRWPDASTGCGSAS